MSPNISHNRIESNLYDIEVGRPCRVTQLRVEPGVCQRLREMGFCEFAEVKKLSEGDILICRVCEARIALSKRLAKNILVEAIDTCHS